MRCAKLAIALMAIASAALAAEPFAGTWQLNTAKSKHKSGQAPRDQTVTISETGSDLDVTVKGTAADGTPFSWHYTTPTAGGEGKAIEGSFDTVSSKRLGPNRRETTYQKGGKVVRTVHNTISNDGKTMTVSVKGTDAEGKPIDAVEILERQ